MQDLDRPEDDWPILLKFPAAQSEAHDLDRREDDWPMPRRLRCPPAKRIDRRHDETYRQIRADCEARELASRQRETAAAPREQPELAQICAAELLGE